MLSRSSKPEPVRYPLRTQARRAAALVRFLAMTSWRAASPRAVTLYVGVFSVALLFFGSNGIDARIVTSAAESDLGLRLAWLGVWVLLSAPAISAWLGEPTAFWVRVFPVPRAWVLAALALGSITLHSAWWLLWLRGSGPVQASWALGTALGLQLAWAAGFRSRTDAAAFGLVLLIGALGPHWALLPPLLGLCYRGSRLAWRRAPEPASGGRHAVFGSSRSVALASTLAVALLRGHRPMLARALFVASAAALVPGLYVLKNRGDGDVVFLGLAVWGPACVLGATAISGALVEVERSLAWLVRASGGPQVAAYASFGLLGCWGAALGAAFAWVSVAMLQLSPLATAQLLLTCSSAGAAWATASLALVRHASRRGAADAARVVVRASAGCIASLALVWVLQRWAVPWLCLAAAGSVVCTWRLAPAGARDAHALRSKAC